MQRKQSLVAVFSRIASLAFGRLPIKTGPLEPFNWKRLTLPEGVPTLVSVLMVNLIGDESDRPTIDRQFGKEDQQRCDIRCAIRWASENQFKAGDTLTTICLDGLSSLFEQNEVSEVWGVGRRIATRMEAMNIRTVRQLRDADAPILRLRFSVVLERTVRGLRSESFLDLQEVVPATVAIDEALAFVETSNSPD